MKNYPFIKLLTILVMFSQSVQSQELPLPTATPVPPTATPGKVFSFNNPEYFNSLSTSAPQGYSQGSIRHGVIPDATGISIDLRPGEAVFSILAEPINMNDISSISARFNTTSKDVSFALIGFNSPIDGQIGFINSTSQELIEDSYQIKRFVYQPPSGVMQVGFQAVNPTDALSSATIWIDEINVAQSIDYGQRTLPLTSDGSFDQGLSNYLINITDANGIIEPFFQSITDIAVRLKISSAEIAANLAIPVVDEAVNFPANIFVSVEVNRESSIENGGTLIFTMVNGYQDIALVRNISGLNDDSTSPENLTIGGSYRTRNQDFPILIVLQNGQPSLGSAIVVDNLKGYLNEFLPNPTITVPLNLPSHFKPLELVSIEPGTFIMGSPTNESGRYSNETQHEVILTQPFWIGKYEVTQAQYVAVMGNNPSAFTNKPNNPVELVSWYDAVLFCNQLSRNEGLQPVYMESDNWETNLNANGYRLPTEAEWEYACRAKTTTRYSFGDALDLANTGRQYSEDGDQYMWWWGNNTYNGNVNGTKEVGLKLPNSWGLYDMHGNVWEWCSDWYAPYLSGAQTDPFKSIGGAFRVGRGGYWARDARDCRSAIRGRAEPDGVSPSVGFRILLPGLE